MEKLPQIYKLLLTITFTTGVAGNITALWILHRSAKKRNAKHVLLLRCLATNDLVSQLGMLGMVHYAGSIQTKCVLLVLLRGFGLGSGCVAFVMAVERWLALTKPFFYQQNVTYRTLKWATGLLWLSAILFTYLPLVGFGYYYENEKCKRYREATNDVDALYAYLFFVFGSTLCCSIAYCNIMVFWALSRIGRQKKILVRRITRSTMNNRTGNYKQHPTPEELAFAKIMAHLCVIFVVCYMPQVILIPFGKSFKDETWYKILSRIADALMGVYFTIDPFVYVIQQYLEKNRFKLPFKSRRSVSTLQGSTQAGTPTSQVGPPSFSVSNV